MKNQHYIERHYTFLGYLGNIAWLVFLVVMLNAFIDPMAPFNFWTDLILPVAIGLLLILSIYGYRRWQKIWRARTIKQLAVANNWRVVKETVSDLTTLLHLDMAVKLLADEHDYKYQNIIHSDDWKYCDFAYGSYRENKGSKYKAADIYYGVMVTELPRKLPHVLFDSKLSKKRQFRFTFDEKQRHSLEGNFDKYFATYFPPNYTVDGLSFITPDVMHELINAAAYDIEIVDDKLYLYAPLDNPRVQIPDMSQHIMAIKKQLLDNIMTYRDLRLPFEKGRQETAITGQRLKRSKWPAIFSAITITIYIIFWLYDMLADIFF